MALTRPKYSQIYDTDYKQTVLVATTGSDVGNLIVGNTQPSTLDGIALSYQMRILVKDQSDATQNGIYWVLYSGTGSNGWWVRAPDANQNIFVSSGLRTVVEAGAINGGKEWRLTTLDPIFLGNTALTFVNPFSSNAAGGTNQSVQFNDLSLLNGSPTFTFNKTSNTVTVSNNLNAGNILSNNYLLANGQPLLQGYVTFVSNAAPPSSPLGSFWYDTSTDIIFEYVSTAGGNAWVDITSVALTNATAPNQIISGSASVTALSPNVNIAIGGSTIGSWGANGLTITGGLYVSANISASYFQGNGSQLTGVLVSPPSIILSGPSNITVTPSFANISINSANIASFSATQLALTPTTNAISPLTGALTVGGGLGVAKDLYIGGNLYVANIISTTYQTLTVTDSLLYLSGNITYPYNYDIGFYGHYQGGPANTYIHTGLVRDYLSGGWYLFSNVAEPSGGVVNVPSSVAIYDPLTTGAQTVVGNANVSGTMTATTVTATNGVFINNLLITANVVIPAGSSAHSVGPISIQSGVSITIASGSRHLIF